jgi:hypothetical protein
VSLDVKGELDLSKAATLSSLKAVEEAPKYLQAETFSPLKAVEEAPKDLQAETLFTQTGVQAQMLAAEVLGKGWLPA